MCAPKPDRSWMLSLLVICVLIWMWVGTGCAKYPKIPMPVNDIEVSSIPVPPDVFLNGTIPFGTVAACPLDKPDMLIGRPDQFTVVYAYEKAGKRLVVFMITMLEAPMGGYIEHAWVDVDGDGEYDLYFDNEADLVEAYPKPCDAIGIPM